MNMLYPKIALSLFLFYTGYEGFRGEGMYTILRISTCLISLMTAFKYYQNKMQLFVWLFIIIAIIFNPVFEIHFNRDRWETIDMVVALIFGISAYFELKANKYKEELSDEMRAVFDRMLVKETPLSTLEETLLNSVKEDLTLIKKGEVPEKRLFLSAAIKRDIVLLGYHNDYSFLPKEIQKINKEDFEQKIYTINRLNEEELDNILSIRQESHNDLAKLEKKVRKTSIFDKHVPQLFT